MTQLNAKETGKGTFTFEQVEKPKKEAGAPREKKPTQKYIVVGDLKQGDKVVATAKSVAISATNPKQAAQYFVSHAKYLGLTAVPKSATIVPEEKTKAADAKK